MKVKLVEAEQLSELVMLHVTVCGPTPKVPPVAVRPLPSPESLQVTVPPSPFVAVTSSHVTAAVDMPASVHWSATEGIDKVGGAV